MALKRAALALKRAALARELKGLYDAGETIRGLASSTGRSPGYIITLLREAGTQLRRHLPERGRPDQAFWHTPEMRAALAALDIGAVFRALQEAGYSQPQISRLTRQTQPEVSAIVNGRNILAIRVLRNVVDGLGIPPAFAGLACQQCPVAACPPALRLRAI